MTASDIMTTNVRTCTADDTLAKAAQIMWEHDCGCVPVVNADGSAMGIVTDRDICMTACHRGERLHDLHVSDAMTRDLFCARPEQPLAEIERTMSEMQIRRVPVVDAAGLLCGVLSLNDIALAMAGSRKANRGDAVDAQSVATTLSKICEHRAPQDSPGSSAQAH